MASMAGVCYANTVDGLADTVDFLNFFVEAYNSIDPITNEPCLKAEDIIVMDNAPTHHNACGQILSELLQELGIELVYMPAYSPDFNPVEYVFGKLQTLMKYQFIDETSRNLKESSVESERVECFSTREINLVFPSTHVFFCLLYKGQSLKSDNFYRKAIIEKR
jgi:transposase